MEGSAPQAPRAGGGAPAGTGRLWLLPVVLGLGVLVRLPLMGLDSGVYDASYFRALMRAGSSDLTNVYAAVSPDYPPLTALTFALTGAVTRWCCDAGLGANDMATVVAAKVPEVVAGGTLAVLIAWAARRAAAERAARGWLRSPGPPALAAAAYFLNPAVVYVSAYWTQAEALWVFPVVLGLVALERRRFGLAWLAFAAGALTKPQAAAFMPLLLVQTVRAGPKSAWLAGPAAALALALVSATPWLLSGHGSEVAQVYLGLSGADPWVSGSAYNLWYLWLLGNTHQVPADTPLVGSLTYQQTGWLLFLALLGWVVWQASQRRGPSLYLSAATLWLGFAVLLTQTHERYFHPVLPLLLLAPELYAAASRLALVWLGVALAYSYNLVTVLPFAGWPGPSLIAAPVVGPRLVVLKAVSLVAAATFLVCLATLAARLRGWGTTWASAP